MSASNVNAEQTLADAVVGGKVQVEGIATVSGPVTISGTVATADAVLDATVSGGAVTTISTIEGAAKGTTPAAAVTAQAEDPNHTSVDVHVTNAGSSPVNVSGPANGGTFPVAGTGGEVATNVQGQLSAIPIVLGNAVSTSNRLPVALATGQTTMSASVPVAIASDQSALPTADAVLDSTVSGGAVKTSAQGTTAVSAASLPLPAGAATAALQGGGLPGALGGAGGLKVEGVGTPGTPAGGVMTVQGGVGGQTLPVTEASAASILTEVTTSASAVGGLDALAPTKAELVGGKNPSGDLEAVPLDASTYVEVDVKVSALPGGAATSALQGGGLPAALASSGSLKTVDDNVAKIVGPPGSTAPADVALAGGVDPGGLARAVATTTGGTQRQLIDYGGTLQNWNLTTFTSLPTAGMAIKLSAGQMRSIYLINGVGVTAFIFFYDRTTAPSTGSTPDYVGGSAATGASAQGSAGPGDAGLTFVNGIWLVLSTSQTVLAAVASTSVSGKVFWA